MPSSGPTPTGTVTRWRSPIPRASRSRRCRSATTAPGSRGCRPRSRRWCPGRGRGRHREQPQRRDRAGAGAGRRWPAGARVRAAQLQAAPREGQVRPHRRAPGAAGRAAPGREPAAGAARRRRPGGTAHLAGCPAGDHGGPHRAGRPAACPAAGRGRHRPPGRPHGVTGKALAALAGRDLPAHASREQAVRQAAIRRLALALDPTRRQLKDNAPSCWPSPVTSPPASPAGTACS